MCTADLAKFHDTSARADFVGPLAGLLDEFRQGNIADRDRVREDRALQTHLGALNAAWDAVFPSFPPCPWRRRTLTWEFFRGRRDAYLRQLIAAHLPAADGGRRLIVNPATVLGRHARFLAQALPAYDVVGTDIHGGWDRLYHLLRSWLPGAPANYEFVREDIFKANLQRRPAVVTFFGACGCLTDASMDYALAVGAPLLACRSCCQENIGCNTEIVRRPTLINWFFARKNHEFERVRKWNMGFYFSERYGRGAYPRSQAARAVLDSETLIAVAQNAPDSDVCRSIVDLDRCLYLREQGYDVLYREELFFAHRSG